MGFIKFKFAKDDEKKPLITVRPSKKEGKEVKESKKIKKIKKQLIGKRKSFVLEWESELGYSSNPFKDEILTPINNYIGGYGKERNKINLFVINNEKFGIIIGDYGFGKTTLLRWLYEQLQQYKDKIMVFYLSGKALSQEFIFLKSIVNPMLSLYEKKIKKLNKDVNIDVNLSVLKRKLGSKKLILLIDDVMDVQARVLLLIKKMYSVMPLQIIMVCGSQVAQTLREVEWLKDELKIKLKGLAVPEAKVMIQKRIKTVGGEDIFPFDDAHIKKICKESSYNPKQILALCQHYAIELAVKQVKRKMPKESEVVKEEVKEEKKEVVKEEKHATHPEVPVLKEIPKTKEYQIKVISQGAEAISLDDLKKDEKGNYKVKGVKRK